MMDELLYLAVFFFDVEVFFLLCDDDFEEVFFLVVVVVVFFVWVVRLVCAVRVEASARMMNMEKMRFIYRLNSFFIMSSVLTFLYLDDIVVFVSHLLSSFTSLILMLTVTSC